ncbi:Fc receptor-like protein 5 [Chrysemys picta bellii]|uniref:Fc receptor-like protein 5 n=1 Tax=Chrysemys picta bellii TaxID=8478 RepID=UPI0032B24363
MVQEQTNRSVSSASSELTHCVWAPHAPPQRPFRVCDHRRRGCTGLMAGTLQELLAKAMEVLLVAGLARLVLEEDGTAVESEAFFQTLPPDTALMLLGPGQSWSPPWDVRGLGRQHRLLGTDPPAGHFDHQVRLLRDQLLRAPGLRSSLGTLLSSSFATLLTVVPFPASQLPTPIPAPPAPGLSLSPPSPVRGQQVQLTCSVPRGSGAVEFILYEQRSGRWERLESQRSGIWRISTENSELSRTFTCSYRVQSSPPRQPHSQSLQSDAVTLALTEPLPAPALSLSPQHPVYVRGERVTLECSAPRGQEVAGYRFYKRHRGQAPEELPAGAMGPLEMLTVEMGDPSEYSCAYGVLRAGREIPSWESPPVPIAVIAPLPAPRLTATPAHPVYVVGEAVALTCSIPGAPTLATVQFSKDGGELPSPLLSSSPMLQLTRVGTGHAGATPVGTGGGSPGERSHSPPPVGLSPSLCWVRPRSPQDPRAGASSLRRGATPWAGDTLGAEGGREEAKQMIDRDHHHEQPEGRGGVPAGGG